MEIKPYTFRPTEELRDAIEQFREDLVMPNGKPIGNTELMRQLVTAGLMANGVQVPGAKLPQNQSIAMVDFVEPLTTLVTATIDEVRTNFDENINSQLSAKPRCGPDLAGTVRKNHAVGMDPLQRLHANVAMFIIQELTRTFAYQLNHPSHSAHWRGEGNTLDPLEEKVRSAIQAIAKHVTDGTTGELPELPAGQAS